MFSSAFSSSKSWFWKLRQLCLRNDLSHPATWVTAQSSKLQIKKMCKSAVLQYWLNKLRTQADSLPSLCYLQTSYLGLTKSQPLFRFCGSSPWEVEKATTQARLMSGRYRVEALTGHWVAWNKDGLCSLPECWCTPASHKGTIANFLLTFPSLSSRRMELIQFNFRFLPLEELVLQCLDLDPVQFGSTAVQWSR